MDDVCPSFETFEEAERFKTLLPEAFGALGFSFKEIDIVGPAVKASTGVPQHLFGHVYHPDGDKIFINFVANISTKKRGQKSLPDLTCDSNLSQIQLTKRKVQAMLGSQYDPLGLAMPFLAKYKLYLSRIHKTYDWDSHFEPEDNQSGHRLLKELIEASQSKLSFPRANKPKGYKLKKLVAFSDGSSVAFCTVLYGIYEDDNGDVHTSLLTSKMKLGHGTVPRNELDGLVASHRLVKNYLEAVTDEEDLDKIIFLTDSTCCLDFLNPNYVTKDVYIINRTAEIRNTAQRFKQKALYGWIQSADNVADKGTRDNCSLQFLFSEEWQLGPSFLKDVESHVEIRDVFNSEDLKACAVSCNAAETKTTKDDPWMTLLSKTNDLKKVLRIYCLVRSIGSLRKFKKKNIDHEDLIKAFMFFVKLAQEEKPVENLKTKQLLVFKEDGVSYTKMRFTEESHNLVFKKDKLPVLSARSRLGQLLLIYAHRGETNFKSFNNIHCSIHQTLVNSRVGPFGTYLTHAKQSIKGLVGRCVICRRMNKQPQEAVMGPRKGGFATVPSDGSAFNHIAIDYFGPMYAKLPKKTKETRAVRNYKIFGLAILCQQTRAIKIYPVEGYDTVSFMTTFRAHCANYGVPLEILSDPMTAFIKASKEVDTERGTKDDNDDEIEKAVQETFNVTWHVIPPGSQWRDPAERAIKSIKQMFQSIFNMERDQPVLTVGEYWSLFAEISEILNRRPIEGKIDEGQLNFICPNDLLIGRTSKYSPNPITDTTMSGRLGVVQEIKSTFWKKYLDILAADSNLMKYPCWYKQDRRPIKGDIVLILYKTSVRDLYRIGKVTAVDPAGRNLELLVSPPQKGNTLEVKNPTRLLVPVQRTILLYSVSESTE